MRMLKSICHLLEHVCSFIRLHCRMLLSFSDVILQYMMLSLAKSRMGIGCCCLCHLCVVEIELVLGLSPVVLQM